MCCAELIIPHHDLSVEFNDLFMLDVNSMLWTELKVNSTKPAARDSHGFVAVGDLLFLQGGWDINNGKFVYVMISNIIVKQPNKVSRHWILNYCAQYN